MKSIDTTFIKLYNFICKWTHTQTVIGQNYVKKILDEILKKNKNKIIIIIIIDILGDRKNFLFLKKILKNIS